MLPKIQLIRPPTNREMDIFLEERGVRNFFAAEMGTRGLPPREIWPNIIPTLRFAELLRAEFGPTRVTSAYRAPDHNAEVGGAPNSLHLVFNALDVMPREAGPMNWAHFLRAKGLDTLGGIGQYASFIHMDTRFLMFGRTPWRG